MLLGVVIPAYNEEQFVSEAIESAIQLKRIGAEICVVNDGSTDGTLDAIRRYRNSVQIIDQSNRGQAVAVESGWRVLHSKYLMYLSADDRLYVDGVTRLIEFLEKDESAALAYGNYDLIDERGRMIRRVVTKSLDKMRLFTRYACEPGVGVVMRRTVYETIGGWNATYRQIADIEYWMRACTLFGFQKVNVLAGAFRVHRGSLTYSGGTSNTADEHRILFVQLGSANSYFRGLGRADKNTADSFAWLFSGRASAKRREGMRMIRELVSAVRISPWIVFDYEALRSLFGSLITYLGRSVRATVRTR